MQQWSRRGVLATADGFDAVRGVLILVCLVALFGAQPLKAQEKPQEPPSGAVIEADDLYIVDCLLPGQLRRIGNRTYMTPKRPTRTTAKDCNIRGGEYTAYDRADASTALKVWLPAAESGDPVAMNNVGEIFEQGLGVKPNYTVARFWFEKAAALEHKPSQVNLARFYDAGLGVEPDPIKALEWYRRAWGIPEEERLLTESEVATRVDTAESQVAAVTAEKQELARLLEQARTEQATAEAQARDAIREAVSAQTAASEAQDRADVAEAVVDSLLASAAVDPAAGVSARVGAKVFREGEAWSRRYGERHFGRYYALVIGNADHEHLQDLSSPPTDAARISQLLTERYGFAAIRIENADNIAVLTALNELHDQLGPEDNLLLYYAGYGNRRVTANYEVGYWLPVNAEQPPVDTYWVPVEQIGAHLARLPAKRVLVVADSSFAGLLADTPGFFLGVSSDLFSSERYIDLRADNRSRLLISSGRDVPAELGDGQGSLFASAFIETLQNNDMVLPAPALFRDLRARLAGASISMSPAFKTIKRAGDAVGDFYFVPDS